MAAQVIVVGNEKGGAGKSTVAIHLATALLHAGRRVAHVDLDLRQQSMSRFFANRAAWTAAKGVRTPMPEPSPLDGEGVRLAAEGPDAALAAFEAAFAEARERAEVVVIDTPGSDTPVSRAAHARADLLVTPLNDSFVDFDMLGHVDPVSLQLTSPSLYAESVWEARKQKMLSERRAMDWLVLRNRLATAEARNRKRLDERIEALARKVGFRIGPGLRDRVIYRELFPFGLTIADLSAEVRPVAVSLAHVAARQELRAMMAACGLEDAAARLAQPPAGASAAPELPLERADAA